MLTMYKIYIVCAMCMLCLSCTAKKTAIYIPQEALSGTKQHTIVLWYSHNNATLPLVAAFLPAMHSNSTATVILMLANGSRVAQCTYTAGAVACTPAPTLVNTPLQSLAQPFAVLIAAARQLERENTPGTPRKGIPADNTEKNDDAGKSSAALGAADSVHPAQSVLPAGTVFPAGTPNNSASQEAAGAPLGLSAVCLPPGWTITPTAPRTYRCVKGRQQLDIQFQE